MVQNRSPDHEMLFGSRIIVSRKPLGQVSRGETQLNETS